jgi:hypothetical protein
MPDAETMMTTRRLAFSYQNFELPCKKNTQHSTSREGGEKNTPLRIAEIQLLFSLLRNVKEPPCHPLMSCSKACTQVQKLLQTCCTKFKRITTLATTGSAVDSSHQKRTVNHPKLKIN